MTADKQIIIRITPEKKAAFKDYADSVNKSVSELLMEYINSCLNSEMKSNNEFVSMADFIKLKIEVNELRQLLSKELTDLTQENSYND